MDIERFWGCTHLRDCSVTRRRGFLFPVPFSCRVGGGLVSGQSELGDHCPRLSAAGHTVGHDEDATAFLHLAQISEHSAFFKAKAYWLSVNIQAGLYQAGGSGDYFNILQRVGQG